MKTSREQRKAHKEMRRLKRLRDLVNRLQTRCAKSKLTIDQVEQILTKLREEGTVAQLVDRIREVN